MGVRGEGRLGGVGGWVVWGVGAIRTKRSSFKGREKRKKIPEAACFDVR